MLLNLHHHYIYSANLSSSAYAQNFGAGNLTHAFDAFPSQHICNGFCRYFDLEILEATTGTEDPGEKNKNEKYEENRDRDGGEESGSNRDERWENEHGEEHGELEVETGGKAGESEEAEDGVDELDRSEDESSAGLGKQLEGITMDVARNEGGSESRGVAGNGNVAGNVAEDEGSAESGAAETIGPENKRSAPGKGRGRGRGRKQGSVTKDKKAGSVKESFKKKQLFIED